MTSPVVLQFYVIGYIIDFVSNYSFKGLDLLSVAAVKFILPALTTSFRTVDIGS